MPQGVGNVWNVGLHEADMHATQPRCILGYSPRTAPGSLEFLGYFLKSILDDRLWALVSSTAELRDKINSWKGVGEIGEEARRVKNTNDGASTEEARQHGEGRGAFQISLTSQDRSGWQSEILVLLGLEGEAQPSNMEVTAETRPTTETTK